MIIVGKNMKNSYTISRIVISVLAGVISVIALHNEHITLMLGATVLITVVALVMSFLATPVSKQMIAMGDRIMNKYLRAFYYFMLLPFILVVVYLLWILIYNFLHHMESAEMGEALGQALIALFLGVVVFIMFIVPYVQSLIVLLLRVKRKDNNTLN